MPSCIATLDRGDRNDSLSSFGVSWSVGPLIKHDRFCVCGLYCWIESGYSDSMCSLLAQPSWCPPVAHHLPTRSTLLNRYGCSFSFIQKILLGVFSLIEGGRVHSTFITLTSTYNRCEGSAIKERL